jgi:hypothetical protein
MMQPPWFAGPTILVYISSISDKWDLFSPVDLDRLMVVQLVKNSSSLPETKRFVTLVTWA